MAPSRRFLLKSQLLVFRHVLFGRYLVHHLVNVLLSISEGNDSYKGNSIALDFGHCLFDDKIILCYFLCNFCISKGSRLHLKTVWFLNNMLVPLIELFVLLSTFYGFFFFLLNSSQV